MGRAYTATGIEILNTSGGTVVDGVGLVSTTNFTYGATDITDQTVSGTAWSILTSGTVPVVLTRNAVVCYTYFGYGTVSASSLAEFQMFNGDNTYNPPLVFSEQTLRTKSITGFVAPFTSGTANLVLKARVASGGGTAIFNNGGLSIIVLGK